MATLFEIIHQLKGTFWAALCALNADTCWHQIDAFLLQLLWKCASSFQASEKKNVQGCRFIYDLMYKTAVPLHEFLCKSSASLNICEHKTCIQPYFVHNIVMGKAATGVWTRKHTQLSWGSNYAVYHKGRIMIPVDTVLQNICLTEIISDVPRIISTKEVMFYGCLLTGWLELVC